METLRKAERWLSRYEGIASENQYRLRAYRDILSQGTAQGIEMLPLKGMDLLLRAYPTLGRRPMVDIDLLVRRRDIVPLAAFLRSLGFQERHARESLNASFLEEALTFDSADRTISLDVIWNFWYGPDIEPVWRRAVTRRTPLGALQMLHPEDDLLYLVAYVVAHRGYFSDVFIQDLEVFLEKEAGEINWDRWIAQVKSRHLAEAVCHGLSYARSQGVTAIPENVIRALAPRGIGERALAAYYQRAVTAREMPYGRYLFPFVTAPGWKGRIRLLKQAFWPSRRLIELRLGRPVGRGALIRRAFFRPFWMAGRAFYFISRELHRLVSFGTYR